MDYVICFIHVHGEGVSEKEKKWSKRMENNKREKGGRGKEASKR